MRQRGPRAASELQPQFPNAGPQFRQTHAGDVLQHPVGRREPAGRQMKSGEPGGLEAPGTDDPAGGSADDSVDAARGEFTADGGKIMRGGGEDHREGAVGTVGSDRGGACNRVTGGVKRSNFFRRPPHVSKTGSPHERRGSIKSSSQYSPARRAVPCARSISIRRSSTRRILPEMVLGRAANSRRRMRLKGDTRSRT